MFNWLLSWARRITSLPVRWLSGIGKLAGFSLPFRVAVVLFVFLILCTIGFYVTQYLSFGKFGNAAEPQTYLPILLLVFAIPGATYFAVRFWLEAAPSKYPDLDEAWRLGVAALRRQGLDINQIPLYFVLGIPDAKSANQFIDAVGWELVVDGEPEGAFSLRWYATKSCILVFLLDGATSAIHREATQQDSSQPVDHRGTMIGAIPEGPGLSSRSGLRGTMVADSPPPNIGLRGTIVDNPSSSAPFESSPGPSIRGTIIASTASSSNQESQSASAGRVALDRALRAEQAHRVERVCELAVQTRQPSCPLNGVLALVDWNIISMTRDGQLGSCIKEDYLTITNSAKLHTPLVLLVTGLQSDVGFGELITRVGEVKAKNNRFGHGFNHLVNPNRSQMEGLASHACGAFEDWIYDSFKNPSCLQRSNNEKLFRLLCKIRHEIQLKLSDILASLAGDASASARGVMLAGCYFAATGENARKQAFVKNVIEKLGELEDDIEWTEQAIENENRLQSINRFFFLINALLVFYILALIVYKVVVVR